MPVLDCTTAVHTVRPGDIVVDTDWRRGGQPRAADGFRAHAGLVIANTASASDLPLMVAHVGNNDFRQEHWNVRGAPKVHLVARYAGFDAEGGDLVAASLLARVLEVAPLLLQGERAVRWAAADRGYLFQDEPFELLATCIGFVHWCYALVGWDLVDRDALPESAIHLSACCADRDWGSAPLRRYFTAFALRAVATEETSYVVTPPSEIGRESPDMLYADFVRTSAVVEERPCLRRLHT